MRTRRIRRVQNPEQYVGQKFNGIEILRICPYTDDDLEISCVCRCHCGKQFESPVWRLISQVQKSCGMCGSTPTARPITVRKNLTGKMFGNLRVIGIAGRNTQGRVTYECQCLCGRTTIVAANNLISGNTKSCGRCNYARETTAESLRVYGTADEAHLADCTYGDMKRRCYDPNFPEYKRYGAKGVTMCDEWKDNPRAYVKWCIENGWSLGVTVDRIDNNGPYAPWNCRIADKIQQANNKSNNRRVSVDGTEHTVAEWSRITGIPYANLQNKPDERMIEIIHNTLTK